MNISLPSELERMVHEKVQIGLYSSASEVIRDALRLLFEKEIIQKHRIEQLNYEIAKGIEAADRNDVIEGTEAMQNIIDRYKE
ncbi:MAG: type II toxin-antitoxin system ParD family antitoxin [Cyanobacteriota bacterium]